jgi:hypothetical protein
VRISDLPNLFLLFFAMWPVPAAAQENEAAAGLPLVAVWALYALMAGSQEPDEFPPVFGNCTQIHAEAQSLMRDFEELRTVEESKELVKMRAAARRTWDGPSRLMSHRIDTGFHRYGIFVIPKEAIATVEAKVTGAIDSRCMARSSVTSLTSMVITATCSHVDAPF